MISGDISPHEFSRFRELGSFVQAVVPSTCVCEVEMIHPTTWHYLARLASGRPLFPSLRELHWTIQEPSRTELLFLAVPSLRRLTVCYSACSDDSQEWVLTQGMLFRTIFDIAPRLTHLILRDIEDVLLPACLSHARPLRGLRIESATCEVSVNLDTLRILSAMQSLQELSFDFHELDDTIDFSGFPALRKLEIGVMSGLPRPIFDAFSSPNLHELLIDSQIDPFSVNEAAATATKLAQNFPSVEDLKWSLQLTNEMPMDAVLAPLFPLRMVKLSFDIHGVLVETLSDDLFAALAKSWPRLIELSITISYYPHTHDDDEPLARTTAHTLLAFARGCPDLQRLQLPRMGGPRREDIGEYPVLQHGLRTLVVDRPGVVGEAACVSYALLLDKFFPNLETTVLPPGYGPVNDDWSRILSGVQLCQLGRSNRGV